VEAKLKIKYHVKELEKLRYIDGKSDWIDLRVAENVSMKQGEYRLISMGISVEIPKGYEMLIVPRSSAYKNFGILQTNAMGVVDESFCGDNDIIHMPILAMRDTEIHINDRIGQFRLMPHQPEVHFIEVDHLDNEDRGGFGTTGKA
jgi:possible dUTP diphosphatase